jgi:hypothetical protein
MLSPIEAKRLLSVVDGDPLTALYRVALTLGMRQAEILGLRWQDVDIDARRLRVQQTLQRMGVVIQPVVPQVPGLEDATHPVELKDDDPGVPVRIEVSVADARPIAHVEEEAHRVEVVDVLLEVSDVAVRMLRRQPGGRCSLRGAAGIGSLECSSGASSPAIRSPAKLCARTRVIGPASPVRRQSPMMRRASSFPAS